MSQWALGEPVGLGGEDRAQIGGAFFDGPRGAGPVHPGGGLVESFWAQVADLGEDGHAFLPLSQAVAGEVFVQIPVATVPPINPPRRRR